MTVTAPAAAIDTLVAELAAELPRWQVPGAQVAVVREGDIVFAGGVGVRGVDDPTPVGAQTLFHHGSCGKAYTALLTVLLAKDKLLDLDAPVRRYVPELRLPDPFVADRLTMRDLLSHRSGLPRHDLAWILNESWSRAEMVRRLEHLPLATDFRAAMSYSNFGYTLAGVAIERITGSTWEQQVQARVLDPVGMRRTKMATVRGISLDPDHGHPHTVRDGAVVLTRHEDSRAIAPAGGVVTCADDAARWLLVHADGGLVDGAQVIAADAVDATHRLHVPMPPEALDHDFIDVIGAALGWVVLRFRGEPALCHAGGLDGFRTDLVVLPRQRIGVAVSANQFPTVLPFAAALRIADSLLGNDTNWYDEMRRPDAASTPEPRDPDELEPATAPAHPLADYVAHYDSPGYGVLAVTVEGSALRIRVGECDLATTYRHFDTWNVNYEPLDVDMSVTFGTDADGLVTEAVLSYEGEEHPIRFRRCGASVGS